MALTSEQRRAQIGKMSLWWEQIIILNALHRESLEGFQSDLCRTRVVMKVLQLHSMALLGKQLNYLSVTREFGAAHSLQVINFPTEVGPRLLQCGRPPSWDSVPVKRKNST